MAQGGEEQTWRPWDEERFIEEAQKRHHPPVFAVVFELLNDFESRLATKEAALRDAVDLLDDFAKAARLICDPVERVEKRAAGYSAGDWAASTLDPLLARRAALSKTGEGA